MVCLTIWRRRGLSRLSRYDFNQVVKDKVYKCNPEDVLSVLLELRIEFDIDEEDFSNLLYDMNKGLIEHKLVQVNLVGSSKKHKIEKDLNLI